MKKHYTYLLGILAVLFLLYQTFNKMEESLDPLWKISILILALFLNLGLVFLILFVNSFYKYIGILLFLVGVGFVQFSMIEDSVFFMINLFITLLFVLGSIGGLFFVLLPQKPAYRKILALLFFIGYFGLSFCGFVNLLVHPEVVAVDFYAGLSGLSVPLYFLKKKDQKRGQGTS